MYQPLHTRVRRGDEIRFKGGLDVSNSNPNLFTKVVMTDEPMELTEALVADSLDANGVHEAQVESNGVRARDGSLAACPAVLCAVVPVRR